MKRLDEFLNDLREEIPDYEIPEYDEGALIDALQAEKPQPDLKEVFGEAFYPKVMRWLSEKLRPIDTPEDVDNLVGGPLRYKLDVYLKKDEVSEDEYHSNTEILARELLQAIDKWNDKVVKDPNLPAPTKAASTKVES